MTDKRKNTAAKAEKPNSLTSKAYEAIKERIITLHFHPGQYISEGEIVTLLDIGRTPVHQAIQRLDIEGLVQILPRKGLIIRPDSLSEILKILDSRMTVEPELARNAADNIRPEDISPLKEIAVATDPDSLSPDILAFTVNDRAFHRMVGDLSGNEVMADFARRLHERSTRFWYLHMWQTIDVKASNEQHLEVAEAIARGDGTGASHAMAEHIDALRVRLKSLPGGFIRP